MRSGMWSNYRDVIAARTSWRRAQHVADQMPEDEPNRMSMRIATRSQLAGTAWRTEGGLGDPGFDELSELCISAGDRESLAVGMAGQITQCIMTARRAEASQAGTELATLLESIENPSLTIGLSTAIMAAKHENGEIAEAKRLAQRAIDVAGGNDPDWHLVFEHPLAMAIAVRGVCKFSMGQAGWRDDLNEALSMTRSTVDPMTLATVTWWAYGNAICYGVLLPDAVTLRDTAETIAVAEQSGDDYVLQTGRLSRAIALLHCDDSLHDAGLTLLTKLHKGRKTKFTLTAFPIIDLHIAREMARNGDIDGAVDLARAIADELFDGGGCIWTGLAADVVVELLLQRGSSEDLAEAQAYIDRLASMPTDPGFVLYEITLLRLRTLLARTRGDSDTYRDLLVRYRERANELGFEGHMALAAEMV
jgi:adenylate cyclase